MKACLRLLKSITIGRQYIFDKHFATWCFLRLNRMDLILPKGAESCKMGNTSVCLSSLCYALLGWKGEVSAHEPTCVNLRQILINKYF